MPGALMRRSEERRHRKLMRRATRYSLAEMPENTFGKIVGRARPLQKRLLEAPISGRLCVYYEVAIDAMDDQTRLRTLGGEQEGISFMLEDDSGRAMIDPAHAYMSTAIDHVVRSTLGMFSDRQQTLLTRLKLSGRSTPFATELRYREAIIEADERIAVFGGGVREPDPDGGSESYRGQGVPTRMCLVGTSKFPLFISDDPRAL